MDVGANPYLEPVMSDKPIDQVRSDMADGLDRKLAELVESGSMKVMSPDGEVKDVDLSPAMLGVISRRVKDLNLVPSHLHGTNAEKLKRAAEARSLKIADYADLPDPGEEPDAATGT